MPIIVIFIFGAVIIGGGAMLAPAWPTKEPRIGLNAAFALAIVVAGALFWAMLFGWNTLVIDYLLFALITSIFLFGTLSFGQRRAEKRGKELLDHEQGWPGPRDLLFFAFAAVLFIVPALVLPVPFDTDAQGFGYLALMAREGSGFTTLAPFHPEITYLYSPGFIGLTAYLSQQLGQSLHDVQFGVSAVLCLIFVLLAYDFGAELQDKRLGRAMAVASLLGTGLYTAFMDSHFTTLMALVFAFAFFIYIIRFIRDGYPADAFGGALMFGATALCHPDTTIILLLGFVPWLITMWFGIPKPTRVRWLVIAFVIPLVGILGILPWLISLRDLLASDIASPFERDANYWQVMIIYHGILIVPIAILGAVVGLRKRSQAAILSIGWLIFALDFAAFGILEALFGSIFPQAFQYDYPFSIAWHAPIIPYTLLGGIGLLWLYEKLLKPRPQFVGTLRRAAPVILIGGITIILAAGIFSAQILPATKNVVGFYGAFSSEADVQAMEWIRQNTDPNARVLNYSSPHEADWAPVISERDTVYFRPQPFFRGIEASAAEQERLRIFWQDPANPAHAELLRDAGIDYVLVPQIVGSPSAVATMWRWREPFIEPAQSAVDDAPYLTLVFDADGARVYEVNDG